MMLSFSWMTLLEVARMRMMMTLEAMLKTPHAVMMIGRRTSMLSATAVCSGSSEMDWKLSFCYNKTMIQLYSLKYFKSRVPAINKARATINYLKLHKCSKCKVN